MRRRGAALCSLLVLLAVGAAGAAAGPAGSTASYVVSLFGTVTASRRPTVRTPNGFSLDAHSVALRYRWDETLRTTIATSSGGTLARSDRLRGTGSSSIALHMQHAHYKDIMASCAMTLSPSRRSLGSALGLGVSFDPASGGAAVAGRIPLDLVRATYDGPVQTNGFAVPCFEARHYDWIAQFGLPLRPGKQAAPFAPVTCHLAAARPCGRPFSYRMAWPSASGGSSLRISALLTARRVP